MRGGERPGKIRWTHPFLRPLQPLSDDAALQTFVDITDDSYDSKDIQQLLLFTDNMPLAVNLIAHAVDFEGLSTVLARWEADKTALLSAGHDRKSNLDASISLSVSSPRITPGSKELLSLLSILPDGISDLELVQINPPIRSILTCKAVLLATALAYQDDRRRLRSLMPVREHVQHFFPPSQILTQSVCGHFNSLLKLYRKYRGEQLQPIVNQINQNLGNLQEVLKRGLQTDNPNLVDTSYCTLFLNSFLRVTGHGGTTLMDYIPRIFPNLDDPELEASFVTETFYNPNPTAMHHTLINEAIARFQYFDDQTLAGTFFAQA